MITADATVTRRYALIPPAERTENATMPKRAPDASK